MMRVMSSPNKDINKDFYFFFLVHYLVYQRLSQSLLQLEFPTWLERVKLDKAFSKPFPKTLEVIFASTFISDISRQFLLAFCPYLFFSIKTIIAWFCEL